MAQKMTVKELIEKLGAFPEDMRVVVPGYEAGLDDVQEVREVQVELNAYGTHMKGIFGEHDAVYDHEENADAVPVLLIQGFHGDL